MKDCYLQDRPRSSDGSGSLGLARAVLRLIIIRHGLILAENIWAVPLLPWLNLAWESRRSIKMLPGGLRLLGFHNAGETDFCLSKLRRQIVWQVSICRCSCELSLTLRCSCHGRGSIEIYNDHEAAVNSGTERGVWPTADAFASIRTFKFSTVRFIVKSARLICITGAWHLPIFPRKSLSATMDLGTCNCQPFVGNCAPFLLAYYTEIEPLSPLLEGRHTRRRCITSLDYLIGLIVPELMFNQDLILMSPGVLLYATISRE